MTESSPKISVVVPVHNCGSTVGKCLDSLIRLDHPSYEAIVVDDGSTDSTPQICRSYSQIRLISLSKGGPSRARNVGISIARGEFVAFTDGDCVVESQWLSELEKGFIGPNVAGVGGDQVSPEDDSDAGKLVQEFLRTVGFVADYVKTGTTLRETRHNPSCNSMYRRRALEEAGGFDENLWPGEDMDLDLKIGRLGYTLMYNPAAKVAHHRPDTYAKFARMLKRYGAAQGYLVKKYGAFRFIHWVPLALLIVLLLVVGLSAWNPWLSLSLAAPMPLAFAWFLMLTRSAAKSVRFTYFLIILLASWNAGFVGSYLTGKPRSIVDNFL